MNTNMYSPAKYQYKYDLNITVYQLVKQLHFGVSPVTVPKIEWRINEKNHIPGPEVAHLRLLHNMTFVLFCMFFGYFKVDEERGFMQAMERAIKNNPELYKERMDRRFSSESTTK